MFTGIYSEVFWSQIQEKKRSVHTHAWVLWTTIFSAREQQHFDCHSLLGKTGIKLGYAVTSVIKCHWHLEQAEGISITQRVHYEWIMHCATSLDMEQSECQNSFEHTFFRPRSRISRLNKDTRSPIFCSFLHYDNQRYSTREGEMLVPEIQI